MLYLEWNRWKLSNHYLRYHAHKQMFVAVSIVCKIFFTSYSSNFDKNNNFELVHSPYVHSVAPTLKAMLNFPYFQVHLVDSFDTCHRELEIRNDIHQILNWKQHVLNTDHLPFRPNSIYLLNVNDTLILRSTTVSPLSSAGTISILRGVMPCVQPYLLSFDITSKLRLGNHTDV